MDVEERRRGVVTALSSALRASGLAGVVEVQPAMVFFGAQLEESDLRDPMPLESLYEYLRSQGAQERAVQEALLMLYARESRLGVRFTLPRAIEQLPSEERDAILAASQMGRSSTSQTRAPMVERREPRPVVLEGPPESRPLIAPDSIVGGALESAGDLYRDARETLRKQRRLVAAVATTLLLAVGLKVYSHVTRGEALDPVTLPESTAGLPCSKTRATSSVVFCYMPKSTYEAMTPEIRKSRGQATGRAATTAGFVKVLLLTEEDGRTRASF